MTTYLQLLRNYTNTPRSLQKRAKFIEDENLSYGKMGIQAVDREEGWKIIRQFLDQETLDALPEFVVPEQVIANAISSEGNIEFKKALLANTMHIGTGGKVQVPKHYAQIMAFTPIQKALPGNIEQAIGNKLDSISNKAGGLGGWLVDLMYTPYGGPAADFANRVFGDPRGHVFNIERVDDPAVIETIMKDYVLPELQVPKGQPQVPKGQLPAQTPQRGTLPTTMDAGATGYVLPATLAGAPLALLGATLGGSRLGLGVLGTAALAGLGYGVYRDQTGKGFEPFDSWVNSMRTELGKTPYASPATKAACYTYRS